MLQTQGEKAIHDSVYRSLCYFESMGINHETIRTKESSWLARMAAWKLKQPRMAMVVGNTVHLYGVTRQEFLKNEAWVRHEMKHVQQFREHGFAGFLIKYTWESVIKGYENNRFEVEARNAEKKEEI